MRKFALAAVLLCPPVVDAQDGDMKKQLAEQGATLGRALATHDIVTLETVWSPKMLVNGPSNTVLTREQVFDAIRRGELDYEPGYVSKVERVEFYGDVAVMMGEDTYTPKFGPEKGRLLHRRSTNVWHYEDGKWMQIARQATIYDPAQKHY